jgi:hypothetical protein
LGLVWARARVTVEVRVRVSTIDHAAVRTRTAARGRQCVKLAPLRQAAAASDLVGDRVRDRVRVWVAVRARARARVKMPASDHEADASDRVAHPLMSTPEGCPAPAARVAVWVRQQRRHRAPRAEPLPVLLGLRQEAVDLVGVGIKARAGIRVGVGVGVAV